MPSSMFDGSVRTTADTYCMSCGSLWSSLVSGSSTRGKPAARKRKERMLGVLALVTTSFAGDEHSRPVHSRGGGSAQALKISRLWTRSKLARAVDDWNVEP